ncbi:hypothetical protein [Herbaspirillum lusitanum]|uniref:hypothetical protein n=1 Tax=Herbaspirillum lusitanum TaxID=213312 RepID=UPI0002E3767A|nr:hypothetical protein [Herbaspirillum lusitanum]
MKLTVLDSKRESDATCYLCKIDLISYIRSIPVKYKDFEVQRGIVANRYLDHLADTISRKKHIPPIVLIADDFLESKDKTTLNVSSYKILDGLQRSHRLKVILDVLEFLVDQEEKEDIENNPSRFSRTHSADLRKMGGDIKLVKSLVALGALDIQSAENFFDGNNLWLEVWVHLSEAEQIEKMLLLNAGHKSVNIKHQLELLFLSTLFRLEDIAPKGVSFIREKEQSAIQYSKGRTVGQYHFSHIISALIALSAGKIINTNSDFVSDLQSNQNDYIELMEGFDLDLMKKFIQFLHSFDAELFSKYSDLGSKWLGREVVLIGLFAAIGEFSDECEQSVDKTLTELKKKIPVIVSALKLKDFEVERNNVELNKVNVGNVNKKAVYRALYAILREEKFKSWKHYFGSAA